MSTSKDDISICNQPVFPRYGLIVGRKGKSKKCNVHKKCNKRKFFVHNNLLKMISDKNGIQCNIYKTSMLELKMF